ncbi:MAG: tRNA (guanosine(46)-N7)-methyltransferase TrmB [Porticoccus sp.]
MGPEYKKKSIRSYVVRAGRMTEAQKAAFTQYWPNYGLSLHSGKLDIDTTFGRSGPRVIEIGFGMGGSLLDMVQAEPEKNFIGIEVHSPGVGRLIHGAGKLGLSNLRVYLADATDVMEDCIEDGSIDRLQVYFPDPWHKKKHNKRRLIQPQFVQEIRSKLKLDGIFHLATDWEPYAEYMMEVMEAAEGYENLAGAGQYSPRPDYRPVTKFEQRGERLGHGVWDLRYKRVD